MKKLILIFLCPLGFIFGQAPTCVNNVSTNPNSPTNDNLPNDNHLDVAYDSLFLNRFNWVPFNQSGTQSDLQTTGLPALGSDQSMRPLYNNATGGNSFYQYINDELVMPTGGQGGFIPNHQNGWELISVNLGFFPDSTIYTDVSGESNQYPRIPYVILYHRYLGKIRVFANIHDPWSLETAYQAARIRLKLNNSNQLELNGLFRLQNGVDQALDLPTEVLSIAAISAAPNDLQRWIIGDFNVSYDPCVCYFGSAIDLDIELIKNTSLKLYGRGISLEEEIINANGSFVQTDFLSNVSIDLDNLENNNAGFIMYKKMEDLIDDYIKRMEYYDSTLAVVNQHNAKVKRNLAIVKWVKYATEVGVAVATGGSSTAVSLMGNVLIHAKDLFGSDTTSTGLAKNWDKAFKEAEKILGKELNTYINDNFKKQDVPAVPKKPTANFSEMYFSGEIQQIDPKLGPTIYTPGAYGNSITNDLPDQHHYPVYNEALGVFALLESSMLNVSRVEINQTCEVDSLAGNRLLATLDRVIQIQLANELKYYFNPALNYKKQDVQVSFEVSGRMFPANNPLFGTKPTTSNPHQSVNIESISFNVEEFDTLLDNSRLKYSSNFYPIDIMNDLVFSFGTHHEVNPIPSLTYGPYANCSALSEAFTGDKLSRFGIDTIQMILLINVEFEELKSNGDPHDYTYIFRYNIDPTKIFYNDTLELYPNLPGSVGDISQYPEDLYLNGVDFDGDEVDGCKLNGTTYLCKAWNDVEVTGTFSVANGYQANVEAGNELRILPESMTPPEMTFSISPVLDFSKPMPPVDHTFITAFCAPAGAYNARTSTKSLHEDTLEVAEDVAYPEFEDIFSLNLYPNPTGGNATLELTIGDRSVINLQVTDISGKPVFTAITNGIATAGVNRYELQTESLAKGIYFVHLVVNGEQHVKRLVKN